MPSHQPPLPKPTGPTVRVRLFGGVEFEPALPRASAAVLAILTLNRQRRLPTDAIVEWYQDDTVTVEAIDKRIRRAAQRLGLNLRKEDGGWQLGESDVCADTFRIEQCIMSKPDIARLDGARALCRGRLLETERDKLWARSVCAWWEHHQTHELQLLSHRALAAGDQPCAEAAMRLACAIDPVNATCWRHLMEHLRERCRFADLGEAYRDYCRALTIYQPGAEPDKDLERLGERASAGKGTPSVGLAVRQPPARHPQAEPETATTVCGPAKTVPHSVEGVRVPQRAQANAPVPRVLPRETSVFIGRDAQVAEVRRMLERHRVVTLTGTGGCGKTRLALAVAQEPAYAQTEVYFVDLTSLSDGAPVDSRVVSVLQVPHRRGLSARQTLINHLASEEFAPAGEVLLVLDNCEHVRAGCAALGDALVQHCPRVRLLAASRERLEMTSERVYRVPSLTLPAPDASASEVMDTEAGRLFAERAGAAKHRFAITEGNAAAITQILRRVAGLPLAIVLAAAHVDVLPLGSIVEHLLRFGSASDPTAADRHQTLQACITWSYNLIQPAEQALLRRLSVIPSGWTLAGATSIASGLPGCEDVQASLETLVRKSLVEFDETQERYSTLETIRQFAYERLKRHGECDEAHQRCRRYYEGFAREHCSRLFGAGQDRHLDELEQEHANLLSVLERCLQSGESEIAAGLRLAATLSRFWFVRGHFAEGQGYLRQLLQPGADLHAPKPALATVAGDQSRASALVGAAQLAWRHGDLAAAASHLNEARRVWTSMHRRQPAGVGHSRLVLRGLASALTESGIVACEADQFPKARKFLNRSLKLWRQLGDEWEEANVLNNLGVVETEEGNFDEARQKHLQSLATFRRVADARSSSIVLSDLATIDHRTGNAPSALELNEEALAIRRRLHDRRNEAVCLKDIAICLNSLGWHDKAAGRAKEAIEVFVQLRHARGIVSAFRPLATSCVARAELAHHQDRCRILAAKAVRLLGDVATQSRLFGISWSDAAREEDSARLTAAKELLGTGALIEDHAERNLREAIADALAEDDQPWAPGS